MLSTGTSEIASDIALLELEIPGAETSKPPEPIGRFASFYLGDDLYAIQANDVAEVSHPLPVTPLPNASANLIGITPLRGEIVAVLDLRSILNIKTESVFARPKILVLHPQHGAGPTAFPIDAMHEIVTIPNGDFEPAIGTVPFVLGTIKLDDTLITVLSAARIGDALTSNLHA